MLKICRRFTELGVMGKLRTRGEVGFIGKVTIVWNVGNIRISEKHGDMGEHWECGGTLGMWRDTGNVSEREKHEEHRKCLVFGERVRLREHFSFILEIYVTWATQVKWGM